MSTIHWLPKVTIAMVKEIKDGKMENLANLQFYKSNGN
jgi:hypothetical protein